MPTPAERPRPAEVWPVFGRWRRRSPAARRLGVTLLVLALLLTPIWAHTPRDRLDDAPGQAPESVTVAAHPHAGA